VEPLRTQGLDHVAITVEDLYEDHGSVHSIYFGDPDGHQIELTTDAV
jgi:catechol-2,3-dioxygenase